jgi:hypothetical protein
MSEHDTSVEKLALRMLDNSAEMRKALVNHAEQLRNLNETIAALAQLVNSHTQGLRMHQKTLEVLAREAGIAFDAPEAPPN